MSYCLLALDISIMNPDKDDLLLRERSFLNLSPIIHFQGYTPTHYGKITIPSF